MDVAFRVDASLDMGTGHVMRCLALADALARDGARCRFVGREHPGHLLDFVRSHGHEARALPLAAGSRDGSGSALPPHADWLGAAWEVDAAQTANAIADRHWDRLVVDHYALDARWEGSLRPRCEALVVLDDLADRAHNCDLLIDQNLGRKAGDYASLVAGDCTVLAGAPYALLRPEFAAHRAASLRRRRPARLAQLLIALGGVDKADATSNVLRALAACALPSDCRIVVAMGAQAPWTARVREAASHLPWPMSMHVGSENMAGLMAESDLAIGAAGTMAWERCSLGLPALTVVLADNQRSGASALAAIQASIPLASPVTGAVLQEAVARVLEPGKLEQMQEAAASVTDGGGIQRVITQMRRQNARV